MATTVAGLSVVLATMNPAQASPCEASAQTVTRTASSWSSLSGPIVTVAVEKSGVSWAVGAGAELDQVVLEYAPVESDGASVSAAVTLPGSATGSVSIAGDGDVSIRFVGGICGEQAPDSDIVLDLTEVASDDGVETDGRSVESGVSAAAPTVADTVPSVEIVEAIIPLRRMCGFMWFAA